jgi:hypothetical protein
MRAKEFVKELGNPGPRVFGKFNCTKDCSGHSAGHAWAGKKGIKNPNACTGTSQSFRQGCQSKLDDENT